MFFQTNFILILSACFLLLLSLVITNTCGLCLGSEQVTCLDNMDEEETTDKLNYALSKYEEVEMKITGQPVAVHGKRITYGDTEELHVAFKYIDNTPNDIIQNCVFVLIRKPGQCETINTICNTYLPITPRPLLEREDLNICEDDENAAKSEQSEIQDQQETPEKAEPRELNNDGENI